MTWDSFSGGEDVIEVEVLSNGIVKVTTDVISSANHTNAEGLLEAIKSAAGGETLMEPRHDVHEHGHHHHHEHLHQ